MRTRCLILGFACVAVLFGTGCPGSVKPGVNKDADRPTRSTAK